MLQSGLIRVLTVLAMTLSGISHAAITVFHNETCVAPYTTCTPAAPLTITAVDPAFVWLNLFYQTGTTASNDPNSLSDPNNVCLSGNGSEVCGWDVHVSTTSPGIVLVPLSFEPDTGLGSDIVGAISGNVLRVNGGNPRTGELGIHRIGRVQVTKANLTSAGSVTVTGNLSVEPLERPNAAVPVISGNTLATATAGLDTDLDGIDDSTDNCPTVANPTQVNGTATGFIELPTPDEVGDACDNCVRTNNPRVVPALFATEAAFFTANQWAALSGGQRDDDHDGYGNKCDADFTAAGGSVGPDDLTQYRAANGKARTSLTACGAVGTATPPPQRCSRFDLNEAGGSIGPDDLTVYRSLNAKAKGPRCATYCTGATTGPLACTDGTANACDLP